MVVCRTCFRYPGYDHPAHHRTVIRPAKFSFANALYLTASCRCLLLTFLFFHKLLHFNTFFCFNFHKIYAAGEG